MPASEIFCVLFCALSVITILAEREPLVVGLKATSIEQLDRGASGAVQLLVSEKSCGLAPEIAMLLMVRGVAPGLASVMTLIVLLVFCFCVPKFKIVALN